jgi:hypothetical protein
MSKMKTASQNWLRRYSVPPIRNQVWMDFLFQMGSCVVDAVDPSVTKTSYKSFRDDMIRRMLSYVLCERAIVTQVTQHQPDQIVQIIYSLWILYVSSEARKKNQGIRLRHHVMSTSRSVFWATEKFHICLDMLLLVLMLELYTITHIQTSSGNYVYAREISP